MSAEQARQGVNLPGLIADEFGTSREQARFEIAMGTVEIDGERWEGDKMNLPLEAVKGKEIVVTGETRHFKMIYDPS